MTYNRLIGYAPIAVPLLFAAAVALATWYRPPPPAGTSKVSLVNVVSFPIGSSSRPVPQ